MIRTRLSQDLSELLVFATGLWGALALLSVLLPIMNAISGTIALKPEFSTLATILALVACFFAFTYSFTEKSHIMEFEMRRPFFRGEIVNPRRDVLHSAVSRFGWGFICLATYVILSSGHGYVLDNAPRDTAKWLVPILEPLAAIFYAIAFGLITGAFGSLAVMQYARPRLADGPGSINLGARNTTRTYVGERPLSDSSDGIGDTQH